MAVEPASDWPLSAQLAQHLREMIRSGQLAAGDRVPSEVDLAREHDVSRDTAQRALTVLAEEGLIVRRRGVGSIVAVTEPIREVRAGPGTHISARLPTPAEREAARRPVGAAAGRGDAGLARAAVPGGRGHRGRARCGRVPGPVTRPPGSGPPGRNRTLAGKPMEGATVMDQKELVGAIAARTSLTREEAGDVTRAVLGWTGRAAERRRGQAPGLGSARPAGPGNAGVAAPPPGSPPDRD